jgi:hypothetical protein
VEPFFFHLIEKESKNQTSKNFFIFSFWKKKFAAIPKKALFFKREMIANTR